MVAASPRMRQSVGMPNTRLNEEEQGLLRKILRALAYRQMMATNLRGHGFKFLVDPEGRLGLVDDMRHILKQVTRVQELYTSFGGGNIRKEAHVKMERIPYPGTRFELAAFLVVSDPAERLAMQSYVDSKCTELADIAREDLATTRVATNRGRALFDEFAADPEQKPLVRQVLHRWVTIVLLSLGRPGSAGDRRAVELGLRTRGVGEIVEDYLRELGPTMESCGLGRDELAEAGVVLP